MHVLISQGRHTHICLYFGKWNAWCTQKSTAGINCCTQVSGVGPRKKERQPCCATGLCRYYSARPVQWGAWIPHRREGTNNSSLFTPSKCTSNFSSNQIISMYHTSWKALHTHNPPFFLIVSFQRKYTLRALQRSKAWTISRASFDQCVKDNPMAAMALYNLALRYSSHRLHHYMLLGHVHSV